MPLMPIIKTVGKAVLKKKLGDVAAKGLAKAVTGAPKQGLATTAMNVGQGLAETAGQMVDHRLKSRGIDLSMLKQDPTMRNDLMTPNDGVPAGMIKRDDGEMQIKRLGDYLNEAVV